MQAQHVSQRMSLIRRHPYGTSGQVEPHRRQWLATPAVDYIHIRNTEVASFIALAVPGDDQHDDTVELS